MITPNSSDFAIRLEDIKEARHRIAGAVLKSPFKPSRVLGQLAGAELWLKFENLQYTASFKERGARNALLAMPQADRARGVVAMSAGNHAQGLAYHARDLGIPATIVMPRATPFMKIENTRTLGATVVLQGDTVDDALAFAHEIGEKEGRTFIHPFNDPMVMAGQGTVMLEMIEDLAGIDAVLVPIGGGGLISGVAVAAKSLDPGIEVFGVEAALFPSVRQLLDGHEPSAGGATIADGIAVKQPGSLTFPIIKELVSDVLVVDEPAIEAAIVRLLEIEKTVVEGAGAVGLAAVMTNPERFRGKRVAIILCGGNIDSRLLSSVILRGLVRSDRLIRIRVAVSDSPGSLARLTAIIAQSGGNIVDLVHQRAFSRESARQAEIDLVVETRSAEHAAAIAQALESAGFAPRSIEAHP